MKVLLIAAFGNWPMYPDDDTFLIYEHSRSRPSHIKATMIPEESQVSNCQDSQFVK